MGALAFGSFSKNILVCEKVFITFKWRLVELPSGGRILNYKNKLTCLIDSLSSGAWNKIRKGKPFHDLRFIYLLPFEYACLPGVISIICGRLDLLSIFWGHHCPWFWFLSDFMGALTSGWAEILIGAIFWLSFLFASTGSHYYKCAPVACFISWMSRFTANAAMAPFSSQHLRSLSLKAFEQILSDMQLMISTVVVLTAILAFPPSKVWFHVHLKQFFVVASANEKYDDAPLPFGYDLPRSAYYACASMPEWTEKPW